MIKVEQKIIDAFKKGEQTHLILGDDTYNNKDILKLTSNNEELDSEITSKNIFNNLDDCFQIIPYELFGFNSLEEAQAYYKNYHKICAYRLKVDVDNVSKILANNELVEMLDINKLQQNNIGHSSSQVFEVELKNSKKAILKIQTLASRNNLDEEYARIAWLENKVNVPKVYYYKKIDNTRYLLMEKLEGIPAYKMDDFAYLIGKTLKEIHKIDSTNCPFKQNSISTLYKNALNNIDLIVPSVQEDYPNMTKEDILEFLKKYKPKDKVIVHGDYSLPNILIDNNKVNLIDLGDVSISSKYFDLFYVRKSFIRNKKMAYFNDFMKGYGIRKINENYMKWISIVDKALF